jgi:hypothetical protein
MSADEDDGQNRAHKMVIEPLSEKKGGGYLATVPEL